MARQGHDIGRCSVDCRTEGGVGADQNSFVARQGRLHGVACQDQRQTPGAICWAGKLRLSMRRQRTCSGNASLNLRFDLGPAGVFCFRYGSCLRVKRFRGFLVGAHRFGLSRCLRIERFRRLFVGTRCFRLSGGLGGACFFGLVSGYAPLPKGNAGHDRNHNHGGDQHQTTQLIAFAPLLTCSTAQIDQLDFRIVPLAHPGLPSLDNSQIGLAQRVSQGLVNAVALPALEDAPGALTRCVGLLEAIAHQGRQGVVRQAARGLGVRAVLGWVDQQVELSTRGEQAVQRRGLMRIRRVHFGQ